jgi:hypothetical protein
LAKKLAFFTQNKPKLCKNLITTLVLSKAPFFFFAENCRKSPKIVFITSTPGPSCDGKKFSPKKWNVFRWSKDHCFQAKKMKALVNKRWLENAYNNTGCQSNQHCDVTLQCSAPGSCNKMPKSDHSCILCDRM